MQTESPSLERTLALLEALLEHPQGLSSAEMLSSLGLSRSTLFALLNTLKSLGYITQPQRGRYLAGPRLLAWRGRQTLTSELQSAFYQETAAFAPSETLGLALPTEEGAMLIAQVEAERRLRSVFPAHYHFPPASAASQALAITPPVEVEEKGYAQSETEGILELALPICADGSTPYAALVWSAPAFRWETPRLEKEVLPALREMAARLSYRLGARHYTPWQPSRSEGTPQGRALTPAEIADFLRAPWIARLACLRPDGKPHVVPVWHEWDGRYFYVVAWAGSLWAEYLSRDPHLSLSVDEPWPPLRRVLARGQAEELAAAEVPGGLERLLERLRRRYLGPGGMLPAREARAFRILPESLLAWQGLP